MKNADQNENDTDDIGTSFYKFLEDRVEYLGRKYPNRPRKAILSMISWCCKQLLRPTSALLAPEIKQKPWWRRTAKLKDDAPRLLFYLKGGVGDLTISSTYLKEFHKAIGGTHRFSVCTDLNAGTSSEILFRCPWVDQVCNRKEIPHFHEFDAVISFCTVPRLVYRSKSKTACWPRLGDILQTYEAFKQSNEPLCSLNPVYAPLGTMYFLMNGHSRSTQADIGHKLGMSNETKPVMILDENSFGIMKKTGLENRTYVTVQRGVDACNRTDNSTKLWPKTYYEALIRKIRDEFPSLCIVQVGRENPEADLAGIDLDLRGRTDFGELKVVLKQSALHIDGECGMVHLTHTLNGRSAVMFGPTNRDFFGYPENINVKAKDACPLWCEWVVGGWQYRCLRGFDTPPCMEQLTPELFFDAVRGHLQDVVAEKAARLDEIGNVPVPGGTILFFGDFEDGEIDEYVRPGNKVWHFSMNLTPEAIRNEKARRIDADYADILNIPMKKESCDAVFCSINSPASSHALREITRILRPGGVLDTRDGRSYVKKNAQE